MSNIKNCICHLSWSWLVRLLINILLTIPLLFIIYNLPVVPMMFCGILYTCVVLYINFYIDMKMCFEDEENIK